MALLQSLLASLLTAIITSYCFILLSATHQELESSTQATMTTKRMALFCFAETTTSHSKILKQRRKYKTFQQYPQFQCTVCNGIAHQIAARINATKKKKNMKFHESPSSATNRELFAIDVLESGGSNNHICLAIEKSALFVLTSDFRRFFTSDQNYKGSPAPLYSKEEEKLLANPKALARDFCYEVFDKHEDLLMKLVSKSIYDLEIRNALCSSSSAPVSSQEEQGLTICNDEEIKVATEREKEMRLVWIQRNGLDSNATSEDKSDTSEESEEGDLPQEEL